MEPSGPMGRLLPLYNRIFLVPAIRGAAVVVVLREDRRLELMRKYPGNNGIVVMSNGITRHFFDIVRDPRKTTGRLLFVGRLSEHKNVSRLLEALESSTAKFGLDIVGDGEYRESLEALVASKSMSGVVFHGRLQRDELHEFYASCEAFVLPSLFEQQPVVLLEALAARVPIIASKVSVLSNIASEACIVVEPTVEGIADGIEAFARMDPNGVREMVDDGFLKVKQLSWDAIIDSYIDLYAEVAAVSKGR